MYGHKLSTDPTQSALDKTNAKAFANACAHQGRQGLVPHSPAEALSAQRAVEMGLIYPVTIDGILRYISNTWRTA